MGKREMNRYAYKKTRKKIKSGWSTDRNACWQDYGLAYSQ